ncbi:MAG: hypothetical protein Q4F05_18100 [bacterium]|nr:hypothetical protein [bacterium]
MGTVLPDPRLADLVEETIEVVSFSQNIIQEELDDIKIQGL